MLALQAPGWIADFPIVAVLCGLVFLVVGADLLVRGAAWIALVVGMSRMAVGLTLVAIGTSLPELLVSLTAARTGRNELAMANVLGSNAANTLLIVGTAAAICAIRLQVRWLELVYSLIATLLLAMPFVLGVGIEAPLSGIMLGMLVVFCSHLLLRERRKTGATGATRPRGSLLGWAFHVALLIGGFFALTYGAEWLVEGAVVIARSLGMSEALIGITIVAIGTSLPELATSVVAALKKQPEICIGNVLGSNIFNVGAVLGVAGLLNPFAIDASQLWRTMAVTGASAVVLVVVLRTCKGVPRLVGIAFLAIYFAFLGMEAVLSAPGVKLSGYDPRAMYTGSPDRSLSCQDPTPKPPEEPAPAETPKVVEAPKVVEEWDDRRAKEAAKALDKVFRQKSSSMRDRNNALEEVATGSNKALVKSLASIIEDDKSIVLRKRAAELLANQPTKEANRAILKLLKNGRVASQNNVMGELIRALSRCGYDAKDWDEIDKMFEREYHLERVPLQEALLELFAAHKEKRAIPILLRNIDEPTPANVDDASNPPAAYWEARWKSWQQWRAKVKEALFAITGQRFSTSAEAKEWLKKNPID